MKVTMFHFMPYRDLPEDFPKGRGVMPRAFTKAPSPMKNLSSAYSAVLSEPQSPEGGQRRRLDPGRWWAQSFAEGGNI
jgi:hypothetical protein